MRYMLHRLGWSSKEVETSSYLGVRGRTLGRAGLAGGGFTVCGCRHRRTERFSANKLLGGLGWCHRCAQCVWAVLLSVLPATGWMPGAVY